MTYRPTLTVFAGPNGSGKSTITGKLPLSDAYINADGIQEQLPCSPLEAAQNAEETRERFLKERRSFTFETVLSTRRNLDLMQRGLEAGYNIQCFYVLTSDPRINVKRVRLRMAAGGNAVREDKIIPRYLRAVKLIPELCRSCTRLLIFDNSAEKDEGGPDLIATVEQGKISIRSSPYWTREAIIRLLNGIFEPNIGE